MFWFVCFHPAINLNKNACTNTIAFIGGWIISKFLFRFPKTSKLTLNFAGRAKRQIFAEINCWVPFTLRNRTNRNPSVPWSRAPLSCRRAVKTTSPRRQGRIQSGGAFLWSKHFFSSNIFPIRQNVVKCVTIINRIFSSQQNLSVY